VSAFYVLWRFTVLRGLISTQRRPLHLVVFASCVVVSLLVSAVGSMDGGQLRLGLKTAKGSDMFRLSLLSKKIKKA
jgi:hypothetical protein